MKHFFIACICCFFSAALFAQPFKRDALQQGLKGKVHWVKRTWYKPLNGSGQPDKSKLPDLYLRPNQLIEYSEAGQMRSSMDYQRGSDEVSGPTLHYYYNNGRLTKEVQENDAYEALYTTLYTYDAEGKEIGRETSPGPADKLGITTRCSVENVWHNGKLVKEISKNADGSIAKETRYTYDDKGRKTEQLYSPAGLYKGITYRYDDTNNLVEEAYLDQSGKPSTVWTYSYDASGRRTQVVEANYFNGKKEGEQTTVISYDSQGGKISERVTKNGVVISDYAWKHTYDQSGNRIQTVHYKKGQPEAIEVLELRYY